MIVWRPLIPKNMTHSGFFGCLHKILGEDFEENKISRHLLWMLSRLRADMLCDQYTSHDNKIFRQIFVSIPDLFDQPFHKYCWACVGGRVIRSGCCQLIRKLECRSKLSRHGDEQSLFNVILTQNFWGEIIANLTQQISRQQLEIHLPYKFHFVYIFLATFPLVVLRIHFNTLDSVSKYFPLN